MNIVYIASLLMVVVAFLATAIIVFFSFSRRKILKEQLEKQQLELSYQSDLLYTSIQSQEKERARIAKDLHDDIGSKLNIIQMNFHLLKSAQLNEDELNETILQTQDLLNKTIEDTRRVSHDLLPVVLENFGLLKATEELTGNFEKNAGIRIHYTAKANENDFSDFEKNNVFRIIQEMLKNAAQHSGAKNIHLSITSSGPDNKKLTYRDDGKGYDATSQKLKEGLGLKSMMSRIEVIRGKADIKSAPGKGVSIYIRFEDSASKESGVPVKA